MDKSNNRFCVYIHTRPDTGDVFYVGMGLYRRPRSIFNRNKYWNNIVAKNNGEFIVDILCENQTWHSVRQMEISLIKFYGRKDLGLGVLCNMTDGGDGVSGRPHSERQKNALRGRKNSPEVIAKMKAAKANVSDETRKKLSIAMKGRILSPKHLEALRTARIGMKLTDEHKLKISIAGKGRVVSDETKLKISNAQKGRRQSLEFVAKNIAKSIRKNGFILEQICLKTGSVVGIFLSRLAVKRELGIQDVTLEKVFSGTKKQAGGFFWRKSYDLSNLDWLITQVQQRQYPA